MNTQEQPPIEGMTPGEYKNGGASLLINYDFAESPFGEILIASTSKGICSLAFVIQTQDETLADLRHRFPCATLRAQRDSLQEAALSFFIQDWSKRAEIKLHLKGTAFQLKVWEALLNIPMGKLSTYGAIAANIQNPNAYRAVGTAVGQNPVSFLIPCHRVIQSTGALGNYHWGPARKKAMIGWEAAQTV